MKPRLEKMADFFAARVDDYDEHMLTEVEGCVEAYRKLAELLPRNTHSLLDLGFGTGLELEEVFKRLPAVSVLGIDLSPAMLNKLRQKHLSNQIQLICDDYFEVDLGEDTFDAAISFQSMHHFSHEKKIGLYARIRKALTTTGVYIECDYMVIDQSLEDQLYAENARLRREMNVPQEAFYHFDTPCTIDSQIRMFQQAGFSSAELVYRMDNTTIIIARK